MVIGIVAPYNSEKPAGFERTTLGILRGILTVDKKDSFIIYTKKGSGLKKLLADFNHAQVIELGWGVFWKDIGLFLTKKSDIYIFIGQQVSFFFAPPKYAVVVYDFAYQHLPVGTMKGRLARWLIDLLTRISFRRAQKVIGISQATIDDAVALYHLDPQKGEVMYPGFFDVRAAQTEKVTVPAKYFLCIGTVKQRKNTLGVIQAYAAFREKHPEYKLVIAGKYRETADYVKAIFQFIREHNLEGEVIFVGHANDGQAAYLYKNAWAVVFPSLLEGFGYPVLEGMSAGIPVITSNNSSLAEVANGAGILVDPRDIREIAQAMTALIEDSSLRQEMIRKGFERIKLFSWEKTGARLFEIIGKL